jgi:hypothetical protein
VFAETVDIVLINESGYNVQFRLGVDITKTYTAPPGKKITKALVDVNLNVSMKNVPYYITYFGFALTNYSGSDIIDGSGYVGYINFSKLQEMNSLIKGWGEFYVNKDEWNNPQDPWGSYILRSYYYTYLSCGYDVYNVSHSDFPTGYSYFEENIDATNYVISNDGKNASIRLLINNLPASGNDLTGYTHYNYSYTVVLHLTLEDDNGGNVGGSHNVVKSPIPPIAIALILITIPIIVLRKIK